MKRPQPATKERRTSGYRNRQGYNGRTGVMAPWFITNNDDGPSRKIE
jgi:hypothetical protein